MVLYSPSSTSKAYPSSIWHTLHDDDDSFDFVTKTLNFDDIEKEDEEEATSKIPYPPSPPPKSFVTPSLKDSEEDIEFPLRPLKTYAKAKKPHRPPTLLSPIPSPSPLSANHKIQSILQKVRSRSKISSPSSSSPPAIRRKIKTTPSTKQSSVSIRDVTKQKINSIAKVLPSSSSAPVSQGKKNARKNIEKKLPVYDRIEEKTQFFSPMPRMTRSKTQKIDNAASEVLQKKNKSEPIAQNETLTPQKKTTGEARISAAVKKALYSEAESPKRPSLKDNALAVIEFPSDSDDEVTTPKTPENQIQQSVFDTPDSANNSIFQTPEKTPAPDNALSPSKWTPPKNKDYPIKLVTKKDGRTYHRIDFSPGMRKKLNKIARKKEELLHLYRFKKEGTEQRAIGYTTAGMSRFNSYMSNVNQIARTGDTEDRLEIEKAIAKSPTKFRCGIIRETTNLAEGDELERTAIKVQKSISTGFSKRNGGGGGISATKKQILISDKDKETISEEIQKQFENIKWRKIKKNLKTQKIHHTFTKAEKKKKDQVYILRHQTSSPDGKSLITTGYIGETEVPVSKRMSQHFHYINHPHKKRHKRQEIYQLIHRSPEKSHTGLLPTTEIKKKFPSIRAAQIETIATKILRSEMTLTNKNKGGGGGASKK